jgi:hypothetical protein
VVADAIHDIGFLSASLSWSVAPGLGFFFVRNET